jgi:nickel-type superoxide dismutase maturation protease
MEPTLQPGDRLLLVPAWWLQPGQVVGVRDPRNHDRVLVKRVTAVDRPGRLVTVVGDNLAASTDSRTFGAVPMASVVGRAAYRYAPSGRVGRLE